MVFYFHHDNKSSSLRPGEFVFFTEFVLGDRIQFSGIPRVLTRNCSGVFFSLILGLQKNEKRRCQISRCGCFCPRFTKFDVCCKVFLFLSLYSLTVNCYVIPERNNIKFVITYYKVIMRCKIVSVYIHFVFKMVLLHRSMLLNYMSDRGICTDNICLYVLWV